jgi:uncharacterized protein (DUF488 family)
MIAPDPTPNPAPAADVLVLTVGHSSHPLPRFLRILEAHGVRCLADVRRFPGSRRHPQFGAAALEAALLRQRIEYRHLVDLGGRRSPRADSPHAGLEHPAFRGYADHMDSPEFHAAVEQLLRLARAARTAIMCAEADWRQCHRRLLSDHLVSRGVAVVHLLDDRRREPHVLLPPAVVVDGRLAYPRVSLF